MDNTLQKAPTWKRIAAWMFDTILLCVVAVGVGFLLSSAFGFDGYVETLNSAYETYETEYGIQFDMTQEEYEKLTQAQKDQYDAAYDALIEDENAMHAYNMVVNLSFLIVTGSILLAMLTLELVLPLVFGNGQNLGKKLMGMCLVRKDSVQITGLQLFVRTLLGKFTIETMIPVYLVLMIYWGILGSGGTMLLLGLLVIQGLCILVTVNRCCIHDLMAGTVVADMNSQRIFQSTEELIAYQKRIAAEDAARQTY